MKSALAETLRRNQREEILALPAEERIRLSLELGERCIRILAEAEGLSLEQARAIIMARRRRPKQ
jgi:hypothetical protein